MPLMAVPEQGRIRRGSEPWVRPITPAQPMNAEVLHDVGSEGRAALAWAPEHPQPLLPLALKPQGPRPAIVTMPTLGVVPAHPLGHRLCSPHDWPQFNARLGELCYLSAYPGDKRRDRCADWLKDYDRLDGEYHRDISEMHGGQQDRWLISPSVAHGSFKKFRYGYGRQGEAVGVLVAQTTEATLAALSRNRGPYSDWNPRPWLNRALSTQHFLHSLVLGELFAHIDVLDLINHHGKMYAVVPLFVSPAPEQLLALPQPLRKTLARRTLLGLSKILRDMHSRQAVHFNVSLDNLFLGHREVLLGGFSAAHFIGPLGLPSERTPAHEPPEMVLDDRRYDCSADIWGLGMVLMRLLCGTTTFLAPYGVPHERGLPAHFWRQYVSWHQAPGQAAPSPRRGLRKAPSLASLLGSSAPPGPQSLLHAQLSQGYAAACATDRELAGFVRKNLLSPRPPDRCQGDALVSAAALFSQATTPKDNAELDGALEPHGPMVADSRQDMLARMGHILSVWRAEANVTMAVGASVRRPSID
jgi:serine/threonine protein kinase